ncbi:hypothetical protein [Haloglycomyces albus]|uniref:hypothetical protein n=1 Tax=Haloglycomyces albus TaxID=526067 RepID=UPI003CCBC588
MTSIANSVSAIDGVESAHIDRPTNTLTVSSKTEITRAQVSAALDQVGPRMQECS